jgi:hypothetical protein
MKEKKMRHTPSKVLAAYLVCLAVLLISIGTISASPVGKPMVEFGPANVFFGNLHSHTKYSDGTGLPEDAYQHARDETEFFGAYRA